jgi:hypothetical protein
MQLCNEMGRSRDHAVSEKNTWSTMADCPTDYLQSMIIIPISQLAGMTQAQIGVAVLSLVEKAKVTGLLAEAAYHLQNISEDIENPSRLVQRFYYEEDLHDQARGIRWKEMLGELQQASTHDEDAARCYEYLRALIDRAYLYLRSKTKPLTAGQQRAKTNIIKLRNGCELCGLLDGKHTDHCTTLRATLPK